MMLWTDKAAADATGGQAQGAWQASRVVIDSRNIQPGDLFVALKGENHDGHDFVKDAMAKGAAAAVVSGRAGGVDETSPLLIVPDTFRALEDLGRCARARAQAKVIGVTGSVGKTSTKEMIRLALSAHGQVYATGGNYNNHIGAPLVLSNLPPDADFAVIEMGMNHAGEIAHLTRMVKPDIAVITNVEAVHMEFFDSLEKIADAKAEIFEGMRGTAILPADSPLFPRLKLIALRNGVTDIVGCGKKPGADCRLTHYQPASTGCIVQADIHGKPMHFPLAALGKHWAMTAVMTLAVTHALGLDDTKTARVLVSFSELSGRGNVTRVGGITVIDDSYNASPYAMLAAFSKTDEVWLREEKKGRKVAALGDMLELGDEEASLHAGLAVPLAEHGFDAVFTAGPLMKHLHDALPAAMRAGHAKNAKELLPMLAKSLKNGDIVLVKGSHGSHMYEVAQALLKPEEKKNAL